MSDQGPIPDRRADDFGLIETLLWTRAEGFALLPEHLARLAASSAALGFVFDESRARQALARVVGPADEASAPPPPAAGRGDAGAAAGQEPSAPGVAAAFPREGRASPLPERLRVRLVLSRDGAIDASATPVEPVPPDAVWRVTLATRRFDSADPMLRHKTTRRALYEDELAEATRRCGADEVLFLNERDELCESARCNLFVPRDGLLLTPPLSCGLLPGTLRARLLAQGRAREATLRLDDLSGGFCLGNSVRGLVRATLLSPGARRP